MGSVVEGSYRLYVRYFVLYVLYVRFARFVRSMYRTYLQRNVYMFTFPHSPSPWCGTYLPTYRPTLYTEYVVGGMHAVCRMCRYHLG
jgi:hypothetical protein